MSGPGEPNPNPADRSDESRLDATRIFPSVGGETPPWPPLPPQPTGTQATPEPLGTDQATGGQASQWPPAQPSQGWAPPNASGQPADQIMPGGSATPSSAWGPQQPDAAAWAQPYPSAQAPRPDRKRKLLPILAVGGVVVIAVIVGLVYLLGRPLTLDRDAAQDGVTKVLKENFHQVVTDVHCPDDMRMTPNARYSCTVKYNGDTHTVTLRIDDDKDHYHISPPS